MSRQYAPWETKLSNGMPVVFQHFEGTVASIYWWVNVGSSSETRGEEGFAHFIEHMLFKDSAAKETGFPSTGTTARKIESLGGEVNAYTAFDQTVYHVTVSSGHLLRVLSAFFEIAKSKRFFKIDFDREREVILEEIRKNADSPNRQLFQTLFEKTYQRHPYGRPVIGYAKSIRVATLKKLEDFFHRQYEPSRMGLVVVSPLDEAEGSLLEKHKTVKQILKMAEKVFSARYPIARTNLSKMSWSSKKLTSSHSRSPRLALRPFDVQLPSFGFSFQVPDLRHPDIPALDLISGILGSGELSRLYQKLFYSQSLVSDISGGLFVPNDPGMLFFQGEMDSVEKVIPILASVNEEIEKLEKEGPTPEELTRMIVQAESEKLYSTQTSDGVAGRLAFSKFILGDIDFDQKYIHRLRAVQSSEIQKLVKKYLVPERMSFVLMTPKCGKRMSLSEVSKTITHSRALIKKREKSERSKNKRGMLPRIMPEYRTLPSGLRWIHLYRKSSNVFSAHISALGGVRLEQAFPVECAEKDWGSSTLLSMTWPKGTTHKSSQEISAQIEGRAAALEGFSGRNSCGLQMTGLIRDWDSLSSLLAEVVLDPSFTEEELEHSRRILLDSVRSIEDHSAQLCSKLFLETLFEKHPYGRITQGSEASVPFISAEKVRGFYKEWMRPDRAVFSFSGPLESKAIEKWVEKIDRQWASLSDAQKRDQKIQNEILDEPELAAPRWVDRLLGREQCHLMMGALGGKITDSDRYVLRLLQTLLSGQGGRLFTEIREKRSLVYSVSPVFFEGIERGFLGTYLACAPAKRASAIHAVREVFERLAGRGPGVTELSRAKEYYMGRRAMDLQSDAALAAHFGLQELYCVPREEESIWTEQIQAVSTQEIKSCVEKYFIKQHTVTAGVQ